MTYKIELTDGHFVYGSPMETRGNDEEFPTFKLDDGRVVSVRREKATLIEENEDVPVVSTDSCGICPDHPGTVVPTQTG